MKMYNGRTQDDPGGRYEGPSSIAEALIFASGGDYALDDTDDTDDADDASEDEDEVDGIKPHDERPSIERARNDYKRNSQKFTDKIFKRIRQGSLKDVKIMAQALEVEDLADIRMKSASYSVLHLALLRKEDEIVEFFLNHFGKALAKIRVQTEECDELTPLYIAIQQLKLPIVKMLLQKYESEKEIAEHINELVYNKGYEEAPCNEIQFAGCVWGAVGKDLAALADMFLFLVDKGLELDKKTRTHGNTLLHLLVLQATAAFPETQHFRSFLHGPFKKGVEKWWKRSKSKAIIKDGSKAPRDGMKYLLAMENNDHLTPVVLATRESPLYIDLINWENVMKYPDLIITAPRYPDVHIYDVTNITSLKHVDGYGLRYNEYSVLHVLAHNYLDLSKERPWDKDITCIEPLHSLIRYKWKLYRWVFYLWGLTHLLHMVLLTATTLEHGKGTSSSPDPGTVGPGNNGKGNSSSSDPGTGLPVGPGNGKGNSSSSSDLGTVGPGNGFFGIFMILPVMYIISEIIDLSVTRNNGKLSLSVTGNGLYRVLCLAFSVTSIVWFVFHMTQHLGQDISLSLTFLFGWIICICFTRTIPLPSKDCQIGTFSIMVQRMLFHDMVNFFVISSFILLAFSAAIHATLLHSADATPQQLHFGNTFFEMLKYYSAIGDGQDQESSSEKEFAKVALSVYGIISVVLLINMLIAALNTTYSTVKGRSTDLVERQKLAILLWIERRLPLQWLRRISEKDLDRRKNPNTGEMEVFSKTKTKRDISFWAKLQRLQVCQKQPQINESSV